MGQKQKLTFVMAWFHFYQLLIRGPDGKKTHDQSYLRMVTAEDQGIIFGQHTSQGYVDDKVFKEKKEGSQNQKGILSFRDMD